MNGGGGSMRLVLATHNRDKAAEIAEILAGLPIELVTAGELALPEVEETGETLEANATQKATAAARASGLDALADDTGLEVDALGGAPGVWSARFAGPDASYADNVRKLLAALRGVPPERRTARFRTVVVWARPEGVVETAEGVCPGRIVEAERGSGGFGYDPIFLPEGAVRTFAEMTPEEKHAVSHRGRALRAMRERIERRLRAGEAERR